MYIVDVETERAQAVCRVREGAEGEPFLMFEAAPLPSLPNVHFGIDLAPGTSRSEARALAELINLQSTSIFAMIFADPPFDEAYASFAELDEAIDEKLRHALIAALGAL